VLPGQTTQFEIRLRNNGLIALKKVRVPVPSHPSLIITPLVTEIEELPAQTSLTVPVTIRAATSSGGIMAGGGPPCDNCVVMMPIDTGFQCGQNFVSVTASVTVAPVCLTDTGCQFDHVDITRVDFMTANQYADQAEWDCLTGHMNECQKARARGYLRTGNFGSLSSDQLGTGLSDFCACGTPAQIPMLLATADAYLAALGFPGTTTPAPPTFTFVTATIPGP